MPVKCELNLTKVEWTTALSVANAKTIEHFQLKFFNNKLFDFQVSCLHNSLENGYAFNLHPRYKPEIEVHLNVTQSSATKTSSPVDDAGSTARSDCFQAVDVWADVNGSGKIILKKSSQLGEWKSDKFRADLERNTSSPPLTCVFWIKFEDFSSGERILLNQVENMFLNQSLCDVQFCFDGGKSVGGHVNILSARNRVFAAMFQNGMKERETGRVDVKGIEPDIFNELLHYIYCGRIGSSLSEGTAQSLLVAAHLYDMEDLKDLCVRLLVPRIRMDNAVGLLTWANLYSVEELEKSVLDFMAEHGKEICQLDDWEELAMTNPKLCLAATRRMIS